MIDDAMDNRLAEAMEQLKAQMTTLAESQREWAGITVSGSAGNSRVKVLVNANGVIIETTFANDIDDLDYAQIAAAVTQAHQNAVTELTRKTAELLSPGQAVAMAGVGLEDLASDLSDPLAPLTALVQPSTEAPKALLDSSADAADLDRGVLRRAW